MFILKRLRRTNISQTKCTNMYNKDFHIALIVSLKIGFKILSIYDDMYLIKSKLVEFPILSHLKIYKKSFIYEAGLKSNISMTITFFISENILTLFLYMNPVYPLCNTLFTFRWR